MLAPRLIEAFEDAQWGLSVPKQNPDDFHRAVGANAHLKCEILHFFVSSHPAANGAFSEAELAPKRDAAPGEATALEALLRGDSLLEKKNSLCKEEETLLEIQVIAPASRAAVFCISKGMCAHVTPPPPQPHLGSLQRVLEAEENGDGFHDDDDFEIDTPKRKNRNRGKVRARAHAGPRGTRIPNDALLQTLQMRVETFMRRVVSKWQACEFVLYFSVFSLPSLRTGDPVAGGQNR